MIRSSIARMVQQDHVNFLLTNFPPRRWVSRWMGRFSKIEHPLIRDLSLRVWRLFADLDLADARETRFKSMHDCFTRRLREGARPIDADPAILVSPCDAIVGACGIVEDGQMLQVKGSPYALADLLGDPTHARNIRNGRYVTLRLTSGMYHRFHAPHDCRVRSVSYIPGDAWNVNPTTLKRVDRLFCRNERAVIQTTLLGTGHAVALVPVAAILVAGIRLNFLDLAARAGRSERWTSACDASFGKGEEMGWFEHGSTIIVLAPEGFSAVDGVIQGSRIRVGQALLRLPTV